MYKLFALFLLCFSNISLIAQNEAGDPYINKKKQMLDSINRLIDESVVKKDMEKLNDLYATDFVFTHSTGIVDSKNTWIKTISDTGTHFISRLHDSTNVELHDDIAIIKGKLTVTRLLNSSINGYALWYIRVFAIRKSRWQLLSHQSTSEIHH